MIIITQEVREALEDLGYYAKVEELKSTSVSKQPDILDSFKISCREKFRKIAIELHPDSTGNDFQKAARFNAYSTAMQLVKGMIPMAPVKLFEEAFSWLEEAAEVEE